MSDDERYWVITPQDDKVHPFKVSACDRSAEASHRRAVSLAEISGGTHFVVKALLVVEAGRRPVKTEKLP